MKPCHDCGVDISHRYHRAERCEVCAHERSKRRSRERQNTAYTHNKARGPRRHCAGCGTDITMLHGSAKRCQPCADARRKALHNEATRLHRLANRDRLNAAKRDRIANDAEFRARRNRQERERTARSVATPEGRERRNRRARVNYYKRGHTRKRLYALTVRQRGLCAICREPLSETWTDNHVDHILPVMHGGTSEEANLQAVHKECNRAKYVSIPSSP